MGISAQTNYMGKLGEIAELDFASEFDGLLTAAGYELPRDKEEEVNIAVVVLDEGHDIKIIKKGAEE